MSSSDPNVEVFKLLLPHMIKRLEKVRAENTFFSHYTSAATAIQIITKKKIWMRNALLMNDFSEIEHGERCLGHAWNDPHVGRRLQAVLERVQSGMAAEFEVMFNQGVNDRRLFSYLVSISEHRRHLPFENNYGRLSMWRAYGGDTNVALVFNSKPLVSESDVLKAYTVPVLYCSPDEFKGFMLELVDGLERNFDIIKAIEPEVFSGLLFNAFHFMALSTKHPGFCEELEWRIIHSPSFMPSDVIKSDIEVVNGVPQRVFKLELRDYSDQGLLGATLPELLEEVIIGPMDSPWPVFEAIVLSLIEAGVPNAEAKVRVSQIPLRR